MYWNYATDKPTGQMAVLAVAVVASARYFYSIEQGASLSAGKNALALLSPVLPSFTREWRLCYGPTCGNPRILSRNC